MKRVLASIDIGSNSIHLLIVRIDEELHSYEPLDTEKEMVRLGGERGLQTGYLAEEAMARALDALRRYKSMATSFGAEAILALATSAVREAENGEEFVRRVREETGIEVDLISGSEEARLIYLGVSSAISFSGRKAAIIDIGGGSTELIVGSETEAHYLTSLRLGAVRLKDLFLTRDPVSRQEYQQLCGYIKGLMRPAAEAMKRVGFDFLIGSSGTIAALADLDRAGGPGSLTGPLTLHHYNLTLASLKKMEKQMLRLPLAERAKLPNMNPRRADIIVPGLAILVLAMEALEADRLTVSDRALREGAVIDYMYREGILSDRAAFHTNIRRRSVLQTARRYSFDEAHATQVTRLALALYDQTAGLHKLPEYARELLEAAAMLHDVGFHVGPESHHKHSYYLIRYAELLGFTQEEIQTIANIARYHRKGPPKEKHPNFAQLTPAHRDVVIKASALLRLAEGLDRSHQQAVRDIECRLTSGQLQVTVLPHAGDDCELELWATRGKAPVFEKLFDRRVQLEVPAEASVAG